MQLGGVLNAFAQSTACQDVDLSPELCNRLQSLRKGRSGTDHHCMSQYNAETTLEGLQSANDDGCVPTLQPFAAGTSGQDCSVAGTVNTSLSAYSLQPSSNQLASFQIQQQSRPEVCSAFASRSAHNNDITYSESSDFSQLISLPSAAPPSDDVAIVNSVVQRMVEAVAFR